MFSCLWSSSSYAPYFELSKCNFSNLISLGNSRTNVFEWSFSYFKSGGSIKSSIFTFYGSKSLTHLHTCTAYYRMYMRFLWCLDLSLSDCKVIKFMCALTISIMRTIMWVIYLCIISKLFIAKSVSFLLLFYSITASNSLSIYLRLYKLFKFIRIYPWLIVTSWSYLCLCLSLTLEWLFKVLSSTSNSWMNIFCYIIIHKIKSFL
jgi:hypothetical protein